MNIKQATVVLQNGRDELEKPYATRAVQNANRRVKEIIDNYLQGLKDLKSDDEPLCIGVVGQMKAGKSSFLNTWLFDGETVLPIAATPMTAGLTTLEYTDGSNHIEICYYSQEDWDNIKIEANAYKDLRESLLSERPELKGKDKVIKKEMEKYATPAQYSSFLLTENLTTEASEKIGNPAINIPFDDVNALQHLMKDCVGANGKFTSVVSILKIYLKDENLKGLRIVDTPGVNDPVVSREVRTHQYLHKCHGVFMLSRALHFMGADDINFMNQRLTSVGVNTILVIGSKQDEPLINPQYSGCRLSEAINRAQRSLKKAYQKGLQLLKYETSKSICDCVFSSGMSQSVLTKLKSSGFNVDLANFDRYETKFWDNLTETYPSDFETPELIEKSLNLLANFDVIRSIVLHQFNDRRKEIVLSKSRIYFEQLTKTIGETIDNAVKLLEHELEYIRKANLDSLQAQVNVLETGVLTMVRPLQNIINLHAQRLQNQWAEIEEEDLSKRGIRVECNNLPTISQRVDYTRKTTFLGRKASGYVYVDSINRVSAKEQQRSAMEKYKQTIRDKWKNVFTSFHDSLLGKLTEQLSSLDAVTVECCMLIAQIVKYTFDVELAKYEVLRLDDTLMSHISIINEYIDESFHSSFNKTFGEKSESDADDNVRVQAKDNLSTAQYGIMRHDSNFMKDMKEIPNLTIKKVAGKDGVLEHMQADIANVLKSGIDKVLAEKKEQLANKKKTINEFQEGINRLQIIKQNLNG